MLNSQNKETEKRRLAWRCRRGMLELDIVLKHFVANHFNALNLSELKVFDEMLALPDNEFWSLISANNPPADTVQRAVIQKLKAT